MGFNLKASRWTCGSRADRLDRLTLLSNVIDDVSYGFQHCTNVFGCVANLCSSSLSGLSVTQTQRSIVFFFIRQGWSALASFLVQNFQSILGSIMATTGRSDLTNKTKKKNASWLWKSLGDVAEAGNCSKVWCRLQSELRASASTTGHAVIGQVGLRALAC